MGLLLKKNIPDGGLIGVWEIEEPEDWFLVQLDLTETERLELAAIKGHRRLEWLASRHLLATLHHAFGATKRAPVVKDEAGKPHFEPLNGDPTMPFFSFSHSRRRAAAALSLRPVGIDIQQFVQKIETIAHKFMRPDEMELLRPETALEQLHVFWGAKEALYKAYGKKQLDFRLHLKTVGFEYAKKGGVFVGLVEKEDHRTAYDIIYEWLDGDYCLVWAKQSQ
jgi:phosphopantetheinyl transferase